MKPGLGHSMICGGIDIGGTKIEARLFDGEQATSVTSRRVDTPQSGYVAFQDAVLDAIGWLDEQAGQTVPVGMSIPGVIDPETGVAFCANIPATGHAVEQSVSQAIGRSVPLLNDAMAFAFSEAHGGAGAGKRSVAGLILGTGLGGGLCLDGTLPYRHGGLAVEIGHLGVSGATMARHGLELWRCGCGQLGCLEAHVSGPGLERMAAEMLGQPVKAAALPETSGGEAVLERWADLVADALYALQILHDPDCVVLGGGVSNLDDCAGRLTRALATRELGDAKRPEIRLARFGDSSGTRGAALWARAAASGA